MFLHTPRHEHHPDRTAACRADPGGRAGRPGHGAADDAPIGPPSAPPPTTPAVLANAGAADARSMDVGSTPSRRRPRRASFAPNVGSFCAACTSFGGIIVGCVFVPSHLCCHIAKKSRLVMLFTLPNIARYCFGTFSQMAFLAHASLFWEATAIFCQAGASGFAKWCE